MEYNYENSLKFLSVHSSIYNFQLTRILLDRQSEKIPKHWLDFLYNLNYKELNAIPFEHCLDNEKIYKACPEDLLNFLRTAYKLCLPRSHKDEKSDKNSNEVSLSQEEKKGMNPKKCHEVEHLTDLVHKTCDKHGCQSIVDIGSGLGYLGQILSKRYGYKVYGLESEECRTHSAENWVKKKDVDKNMIETITFHLKDEADCYEKFEGIISALKQEAEETCGKLCKASPKVSIGTDPCDLHKDMQNECKLDLDCTNVVGNRSDFHDKHIHPSDNKKVCMTGLHCCGDLTPTMLKFFVQCPSASCLVCLGCCYHNMNENETGSFNMWPLSKRFQEVVRDTDENVITKYALRLAAQETRTRWSNQTQEDHEYHKKNVAFRALLEIFCTEENITLVKGKRKLANKRDYDNLDSYVTAVVGRIKFDKGGDYVKRRMWELYSEYEEGIRYIEVITCLQVILQPVIESMIVMDRIYYLHEHEIKADVIAIFDENISPRNLAIVAMK